MNQRKSEGGGGLDIRVQSEKPMKKYQRNVTKNEQTLKQKSENQGGEGGGVNCIRP